MRSAKPREPLEESLTPGGFQVLDRSEAIPLLGPDEARSLTDRIKARSEELWHLLLEAYEGAAHTALGYKSWGAYFEAEYGGGKSQAYRVLDAGRVVKAMEEDSPIGERPAIPNEYVARELAPLKGDPETMNRVWGDVVEEARQTGEGVTAEKVRAKVEERKEPSAPWSDDEFMLKGMLEAGRTTVVSMAKDGHPNLVAWAKDGGLFTRIDRASEWGNPFEVGKDGNREAVVENYDLYYLPHKPSLLKKLPSLKGKALGCWCAPKSCHGNVLVKAVHSE
jgi:hypothetical protein